VIGGSCYCSSEAPPPGDGSIRCNVPCTANENAVCGNPAYGAFSFFRRIITTIDPPSNGLSSLSRRAILEPVPEPASPPPEGWQYSGCFFANDFIVTSPFSYAGPEGMNAAQCTALASSNGYTYVGLRNDVCYASNAAPVASLEAGLGLCATACPGYPAEACGGSTSPLNTGAELTQLVTLYSRSPSPPTLVPGPNLDALLALPTSSSVGPGSSAGPSLDALLALPTSSSAGPSLDALLALPTSSSVGPSSSAGPSLDALLALPTSSSVGPSSSAGPSLDALLALPTSTFMGQTPAESSLDMIPTDSPTIAPTLDASINLPSGQTSGVSPLIDPPPPSLTFARPDLPNRPPSAAGDGVDPPYFNYRAIRGSQRPPLPPDGGRTP
jgi:hypothetical protein